MKRIALVLVLLIITLALTSCTVNWFGETRDVPWYYVAIPVVVIAVAAYFILMSKTFICPYCNTEFKAKPYQLYVAIHMNRKRYAKCPNCKRKGFFKVKK